MSTPKSVNAPSLTPAEAKALNLKCRGTQGIISAVSVFGVFVVVVMLSKLNEVRMHRLPFLWKGRLKKLVMNSAKNLRIAEESTKREIALHHAVQSQSILHAAQEIGGLSLSKYTGMDIEVLEHSINETIDKLHKSSQEVKQADQIEPMTKEPLKPALKKKSARFGSPIRFQ